METPIEVQIEKSQMFTTGHDKWEHYRRGALLDLQREGFATVGEAGNLTPLTCVDDTRRLRAWTNDSLIWTIDRIRENRNAEAIRGFLQVIAYNARANGTFCYPHIADAVIVLRNHFEDLLKKGEQVKE